MREESDSVDEIDERVDLVQQLNARDVSVQEAEVLEVLDEKQPLTRKEIEYETMGVGRTVLNVLRRLRDAGLVERRRWEQDRRKVLYELSGEYDGGD